MPLSPKPYRDWDENDVAQLIEDPPAEESARLDFKKDISLLSKDEEARRRAEEGILKDIASMANAGGGAILIGVDQERGTNSPRPVAKELTGIPAGDVEKLKQRIFVLVDNHLDVRPPRPIITDVPVAKGSHLRVLIVQVQQNTYSLSMVKKDGLNQFWHRRGWDNTPMSTQEIEYAFEQMTRLRRPAEAELKRIERRVTQGVRGPVAWVAIVPLRRSRDHVPTDPIAIKDALKKASEWDRFFPETDKPIWYTNAEYKPFLRGQRTCDEPTPDMVIELHRDGNVLCRLPGCSWFLANSDPTKTVFISLIYEAWAGGLCVFRELASQFGFPSVAVAGAGCSGFTGRDLRRDDNYHRGPIRRNLTDDSVVLDPILLPETWDPRDILATWAGEMANWLGEAKAFSFPPYVK